MSLGHTSIVLCCPRLKECLVPDIETLKSNLLKEKEVTDPAQLSFINFFEATSKGLRYALARIYFNDLGPTTSPDARVTYWTTLSYCPFCGYEHERAPHISKISEEIYAASDLPIAPLILPAQKACCGKFFYFVNLPPSFYGERPGEIESFSVERERPWTLSEKDLEQLNGAAEETINIQQDKEGGWWIKVHEAFQNDMCISVVDSVVLFCPFCRSPKSFE